MARDAVAAERRRAGTRSPCSRPDRGWAPDAPGELAASMLVTAGGEPQEPSAVHVFGAMLGRRVETWALLEKGYRRRLRELPRPREHRSAACFGAYRERLLRVQVAYDPGEVFRPGTSTGT
jgi:hypothetical protein